METQLGVRPTSRAPGHLPTSGASRLGWAGRRSTCVALSPPPLPSVHAGNDAAAHLPPASYPLSFLLSHPHLSVSVSLTPSVSGPGSPALVRGHVNVVFPISSAGLPAWLTFNLIRGGASAEPLIKAGRQLGECQGGLGPRRRPRPGAGAMRGEGAGGWLPLSPPSGPDRTTCGL